MIKIIPIKIKIIPIRSDVSTPETKFPILTKISLINITTDWTIVVIVPQARAFMFHFSHKRKNPSANNPKTRISKL